MNSRLLKWQLIACAVFGSVLLVEWIIGESNRGQLQTILDKQIQSDYQSEPMPTLNKPNQVNDSFIEIVERPLFIEGRKPLPDQVEETDTTDNGQLDDWLLIGIYNKNKQKMALFRKQNEAKTFLKLHESQMISGWQLTQIQDDRVVLQQGGQQKAIMLRKPREKNQVPVQGRRPVAPNQPFKPAMPTPNNSPDHDNNDS